MRFYIFVGLLFFVSSTFAQDGWFEKRDTSNIIGKWIFNEYCDSFPEIYLSPENFELQLIYVQIDRDNRNYPHLTYYKLGVDKNKYFYPASLVKLPTIMLSLEKLHILNSKYNIDKYSQLKIGKHGRCQSALTIDTSGKEKYPCIANFIRKILLVSDNQSYNRLYEFVGQKDLNEKMWNKGYTDNLIINRFSACNYEQNRNTNPFQFYDSTGKIVYYQPPKENPKKWHISACDAKIGEKYVVKNDTICKPKDFTYSNRITLESELDMMVRFFLPETVDSSLRWNISSHDRLFLMQYLSMYPRQSLFSKYKKYDDSYKKYFIFGDVHDTIKNQNLKIFNIVGLSYGFSSDVAYVVNIEKGIEFFLAAVIYTNQNGIINDGNYEYRTIAFPFFSKFGRIVYNYELERYRKCIPDFNEIRTAIDLPAL